MDDSRTKAALDTLADLYLTGAAPAKTAGPGPGAASALDGPQPIRLAPKLRAAAAAAAGLQMPASRSPQSFQGPGLRLQRHVDQAASTTARATGSTLVEEPDEQVQPAGHGAVEAVFLGNLPGFGGPWLTQYARYLATGPGPVAVLRIDPNTITLELVSTPKPPVPSDLGQEDSSAPQDLESWAAGAAREGNLLELLDGLAHFEGTPVRHWLVHFSQSATPVAMAMAGDLAHWTFLCGSDQAAVVGSYRLLKQLIEVDAGRSQRRVGFMIMGSDEEISRTTLERLNAAAAGFLSQGLEFTGWLKQMAPVSLHIVGNFTNTAAMWDELVAFFHDQAGSMDVVADDVEEDEEEDQLAFPTAGQRTPMSMDARRGASLDMEALPEDFEVAQEVDISGARQADDGEAPYVSELMGSLDLGNASLAPASPPASQPLAPPGAPGESPEAPQAAAAMPSPSISKPPEAYEPAAIPAAPTPAPETHPPRDAEIADRPRTAAPAQPSEESPRTPGRLNVQTPQPGPRPSPVNQQSTINNQQSDPASPDLAQYIPGGVLLEARCPRHPQTRLVLDEAGVLHLLRRHGSPRNPRNLGVRRDPAAVAQAADSALRAAVVDLMEARAWVRENLDLLRMTQRQYNFDSGAEPVLHLFTDQAKLAAALVGQLGTFIKLHLLHEIHVGGTVSWYCAELN